MSKRLRMLEAITGSELLNRTPRGVTLTPTGEQLYNAAQRVLASADTVNDLITSPAAASALRGSVARLGCTSLVADVRLTEILVDLSNSDPWLSVEVLTANSRVVRRLIPEGRVDIGIVATDTLTPSADELNERPLWDDELVLAVPPGHEWERYDEVPLREFRAAELIERDPWEHSSRMLAVAMEHHGIRHRPTPRARLGTTQAMLEVSAALGIPALASISAVPSEFSVRRLEDIRLERQISMVWAGTLASLPRPAQLLSERLTRLSDF